jgi:hypothetical protein
VAAVSRHLVIDPVCRLSPNGICDHPDEWRIPRPSANASAVKRKSENPEWRENMRRLLLLALLTSVVKAHDLYPRLDESMPRVQLPVSSGLLTDRISKKGLKRWQEIERFIFVKDAKGQPLHRTLVSLWRWVQTSGHAVYIEIVQRLSISTCTAGSFRAVCLEEQVALY